MGYMRHHAIIVTGSRESAFPETPTIQEAYAEAKKIFPAVTEIVPSGINGYWSFLVPPDGSKEGWDESREGNDRRDRFIAWLDSRAYDDGSHSLDYAEVMYGDDDGERMVTRSDDDCYLRAHLAPEGTPDE